LKRKALAADEHRWTQIDTVTPRAFSGLSDFICVHLWPQNLMLLFMGRSLGFSTRQANQAFLSAGASFG
jgi:hypothetical protein